MIQELLQKISYELGENSIPYMVIGGQAVLLYGEPRLTKDIDITLGVGVEELKKVEIVVARLNLRALVEDVEPFVKKTMVLPSLDTGSGIRVDFIFSFSPYEKQAIGRAKDVKFGETSVKFASLEDVVIHKVIAGRARDIEDVKKIILKNPRYDFQYISTWLKEFDRSMGENFEELFKEIVKDAG